MCLRYDSNKIEVSVVVWWFVPHSIYTCVCIIYIYVDTYHAVCVIPYSELFPGLIEEKSFMNHLEHLVITVFLVNLCIVIIPLIDIASEA